MKWKKLNPKKNKAQAMVEFALALPLLLLLLYGILETGRLLFMYSTVVTASRQAVRYGAATGTGNGTGNANEPRYQDCDGIRAAAQRVGYVGAFNTITLRYDTGPSTSQTLFCSGASDLTDPSFRPSTNNTSRISVTVEKQFTPIVKLVPFAARTISATSARTILVSVAIQVTMPPVTFVASSPTDTPTPTPTPTATETPTNTPTATETPLYTYTPSTTPTITRTPTITLTGTITRTPTITVTPTLTVTRVPSCNSVSHGPIVRSGNTMTMTITNPYNFPLTTGPGTVTWNNDKGHQTGSDKTLSLQSITVGSTSIWTGNSSNVSTIPFTNPAIIPPLSTVTITFTFHQSYDNFDGTENIYINLITPGCENNPVHS